MSSASTDPDLAALDALFAAATPGEWEAGKRDGSRFSNGAPVMLLMGDNDIVAYDLTKPNAALIAALHNAWPALRRDLEIGRAAVEVDDAWNDWNSARGHYSSVANRGGDCAEQAAWVNMQAAAVRLDAARAKLRALREAQNG